MRFGVLLFWRLILTVNICDDEVLCGNKAAEALDKYIQRLEERKVEGLTEKQVNTLIKTAKALRTAIVQSKSTEKSRENNNKPNDDVYIISLLKHNIEVKLGF